MDTNEKKQKFLSMAMERGYIGEELIREWDFLPLQEFLENGYIAENHYHELMMEIEGITSDDLVVLEEEPSKVSLKTLMNKSKPQKPKKPKAAVQTYEGTDLRLEVAERMIQEQRSIHNKLQKRNIKSSQQQLITHILISAGLMGLIHLLIAKTLLHFVICVFMGGSAAGIAHYFKGKMCWGIYIGIYILNFIFGQIGYGIIHRMTSNMLDGTIGMLCLGSGLLLFTGTGYVIGDTLENSRM